MIGIILGAIVGGVMGFLMEPVGFLLGTAFGAAAGLLIGMALGAVAWSLIPKLVRIIVTLGILFATSNWIAEKYFHLSFWQELTRLFPLINNFSH